MPKTKTIEKKRGGARPGAGRPRLEIHAPECQCARCMREKPAKRRRK